YHGRRLADGIAPVARLGSKTAWYNPMMRVGIGYDVHRLEHGRPLVLGGITIPHEVGLAGHSDADALTHAIIDALLGAAAKGDIGTHCPDTEEAYRGADSLKLLGAVVRMLTDDGYQIQNVDATLAIQRPRLRPFIEQMRERLSAVLQVPV